MLSLPICWEEGCQQPGWIRGVTVLRQTRARLRPAVEEDSRRSGRQPATQPDGLLEKKTLACSFSPVGAARMLQGLSKSSWWPYMYMHVCARRPVKLFRLVLTETELRRANRVRRRF